jgi:hypothetical protein
MLLFNRQLAMGRLKGSNQKSKPVKGRKKHADYSEESKAKKRERNALLKRKQAAVRRELLVQNNNNDQDIIVTNHYYKSVGDILSGDHDINHEMKIKYLNSVTNSQFDDYIDDIYIDAAYASVKVLEYNHVYKYRRKVKTLVSCMEKFVNILLAKVNGGDVLKSIESDIIRKYRNGPFSVPKISLMMDECYQSSIGLAVIENFSKLIRSVKLQGVKNVIPSRSVVQQYNNWLSAGMSLRIRHKILFDGAGCILDIADVF